jgi:hypothetical protein
MAVHSPRDVRHKKEYEEKTCSLDPQQLHAVTVSYGNPISVCFGPLKLIHGGRCIINQNWFINALGEGHEVPYKGHAVVGCGAYVALAVGRPCDAVDAGIVSTEKGNWHGGHADIEDNHLTIYMRRGRLRMHEASSGKTRAKCVGKSPKTKTQQAAPRLNLKGLWR